MPAFTCPTCDRTLEATTDGAIKCAGCRVAYPVLDTVPFLWSDPAASLVDWRNRWNFALAEIESELAQASAAQPDSNATTDRLRTYTTGLERYLAELKELLAPLAVGEPLAKETHLALRARLPKYHHLLAYVQNVHRDWCWGDAENEAALETVACSLKSAAAAPGNVLVLGAGSGRLAYDLQRSLAPASTVAVDSNPLLGMIGARMARGETVKFSEFPLAPISATDVAVERELSAPEAIEGLSFVCADALRLPFAPAAFDLVVTPWLMDVIDADPDDFIGHVAATLQPGGLWLNHGSVAFSGSPLQRMTIEEIAACAESQGFVIRDQRDVTLPYLQSPASRHHRTENTHTLCAELVQPAKEKRLPRHKHLPDWIVVGKSPVPLSQEFHSQITTIRIHAFIMSLIDGQRSLNDIAQVLEDQRLMPKQEAAQAIRNFLTTMYAEGK